MTMITESPDRALKSALEAVEDASQRVERLSDRLHKAQARANDAQNFVAAAALEFQNADARFLVLKGLLEKQGRLESELADAEKELSRAREMENSVHKALTALKKATTSAQRLVTSAETVVTGLDDLKKKLDADADAAPNGHKASLTNAARSVGGLHTKLVRQHRTLQNELDSARADYDAIPKITGLEELREEVASLKEELHSVKTDKDKHPAVSAADLEKAKADLDNAQLVRDQAPEADQDAQANLRATQSELADAQTGYATAVTAFEQVEGEFIDRIVVSEPDATGWATARAVLKPGMEIPKGYNLRWQAGGAPIKEPDTGIALVVRIDANALPVGDTAVEATIERQS